MTLDFIKNNPFPNLDEFTQIMFNISKKSNSSFVVISSYDYRTLKKMYENILEEHIIRECGRFLYSKDGMKDMIRCHNLLDEIINYNYNKGNNDKYDSMIILSLTRLIEHWWDGIGNWKA
jgi:hypothetical protein